MLDRATKILLSCCLVVLLALLLRPQFGPAFGQSPSSVNSAGPTIFQASDGYLYVVANGKLSVWKPGTYQYKETAQSTARQLEEMQKSANDPSRTPAQRQKWQKVMTDFKLRSQNVQGDKPLTLLEAQPLP